VTNPDAGLDDCGTGHSEGWDGLVRKVLVDAGAVAALEPAADAKKMPSGDVSARIPAASRLDLCSPGVDVKVCLDSGR